MRWGVVAGCFTLSARCAPPRDSLQITLDRHASAVARLPEEEQTRLMPYGHAVVGEKVAELLPPEILTIEQARGLAVRGNPDVHAAQARLQAAAARIDEARSRYYPTVSFSHNSTRTFQVPASRNRLATALQPTPFLPTDLGGNTLAITTLLNALRQPLFGGHGGGDSSSFSEHSSSFTASWTIFDGLVREAQVLAAKHLHAASKYSLLDVQRLLVRSVDAAYYQIQLAEEQLRIAQADEKFSSEQYEETRKLKAAGRSTAADVDNFRVRSLAAQANLKSAEGLLETGRVALAELMGLPGAEMPAALRLSSLADETESEMAEPQLSPLLSRALKDRSDIIQLEQILGSEEENVRAAKGAYNPTLQGSASWGYDHTSTMKYSEDDQSSAAGIEMRWEIFSGGRRNAQLRAAESVRSEAVANLNRLKLTIQGEVRRAVIDVTKAQAQIRLQRENVETARENRRIVQAGYLGGKETLNRLNEAQRDFITADADLALARIRLRQAWSDLRAAAGGALADAQPRSDDKTNDAPADQQRGG